MSILRRLAVLGAATMMTLGLAVAPAQAASRACTNLWTPDGKGRINMCKTWTRHANGKGYYGEFWGTIHGKNTVLEAWFDGRQERIAGTGSRSSLKFNRRYERINRLYFRACKRGKACSGPWW
ncbi:MAG TPA: hypothetical protein VNV66_06865 [Pilimelia sp.]|nr:hypothetical protein [Pilimelia sp.]